MTGTSLYPDRMFSVADPEGMKGYILFDVCNIAGLLNSHIKGNGSASGPRGEGSVATSPLSIYR